MPFAYPPLALYTMAFAIKALHLGAFDYLKIAPSIFVALSAVPLYALFRRITASPGKAAFAVSLALSSPDFLFFDLFADGSVRAFAFFWTACAVYFLYVAFLQLKPVPIVLSGIAFGFALLSHPENGLFVALTVLALFIWGRSSLRSRLTVTLLVLTIATIVASPWLVEVVHRYGLATLMRATHTHGGGILGPLSQGIQLRHPTKIWLLRDRFEPYLRVSWPLYALGWLGAGYLALTRRWLLPCWLVLVVVLVPESARFIPILFAAITIVAWPEMVSRFTDASRRYGDSPSGIVSSAAVLVVLLAAGISFAWLSTVKPVLSTSDLAMAATVHARTAVSSTFDVVTSNDLQAEWFPFQLPATSQPTSHGNCISARAIIAAHKSRELRVGRLAKISGL